MSNRIPRNYDAVVALLEDAADGADAHGAGIGLKQNDGAAIRADLTALVGVPAGPGGNPPAVPGLKSLWNGAKAAKVAATGIVRSAISQGRAVAMACVATLKTRLGGKWSSAWEAAGFTGGSLEIPDNPQTLLLELRAYYVAHPDHEVPNISPTIGATAAACQAAADSIGDADTASNQSNSNAGTAKAALETGLQAGIARLGGLREELTRLIEDDDVRWLAFGFTLPGAPDTPAVPQNLVVTPGPAGTLILDWDDAARAESYRVVATPTAGNGAPGIDKIVEESDTVLVGLPTGASYAIAISSRNAAGGESSPGPSLRVTVP